MPHTRSCGNARAHYCRCTGCAGALHAWPGALELAQPSMEDQRTTLRDDLNRAWSDATKGKRSRKPSIRKKAAAADQVKADIIDWLAAELVDPNTDALTSQLIDRIGNYISIKVVPQLESGSSFLDKRRLRRDLTDHFWCDLLAQFACAMNTLGEKFDEIPERLAAAIWSSRSEDKRTVIDQALIQIAVKVVIEGIRNLTPVRHFDDLCRAIRILATLNCPAPERHRAVVECCIDPLARDIISDLAKQRLLDLRLDLINDTLIPTAATGAITDAMRVDRTH